jgi:uncharacterized protein YbjT (DUF2867 family)
MILVLGASGNIGRALVAELRRKRAPFAVGLHRPEEIDKAQASGLEVVAADYFDPASLVLACKGKEKVFFVSPASARLLEMETNVLRAAHRTGVTHLIKSSVWGADRDDFIFARPHRESERQIEQSGIPYTFLRPNGFFQNLLSYATGIKQFGMIPIPDQDAAVSEVDVRDIGAAAAAVLTTEGHAGRAYPISGPEAITTAQKTQILSEVTGRRVRAQVLPAEQWVGLLSQFGVPEWQLRGIIDLQRYYSTGKASTVVPTIQELTGTPARSFRSFVEEYRSTFLGASPSSARAA